MTAAYHKNANPDNERVHKVIEELLRIITQTPPENWNEQLPAVEFAINNAVTTRVQTVRVEHWYEPVRSKDC